MTRVNLECIPCILGVRVNEIKNIVGNRDEALSIAKEMLSYYLEVLRRESNITVIATLMFRWVKNKLDIRDPYRELKNHANSMGIRVYRELKNYFNKLSRDKRLEMAIRLSLIGNSLDLGVIDYTPPSLNELINMLWNIKVKGLNHIHVFEDVSGKLVLFLLDNSGEAVLDRFLAEELVYRGARVLGVVKSGSFQNDVTIEEVDYIGLRSSFSGIVETGTDASSIFFDEITDELKTLLSQADLIIAKGMANYEYLSDYEVREGGKQVVYMLRAKCEPIARSLGVEKGDYVLRRAWIKLPW